MINIEKLTAERTRLSDELTANRQALIAKILNETEISDQEVQDINVNLTRLHLVEQAIIENFKG